MQASKSPNEQHSALQSVRWSERIWSCWINGACRKRSPTSRSILPSKYGKPFVNWQYAVHRRSASPQRTALLRDPNLDADSDELAQEVKRVGEYMATSRPTAVNLFWAIERMERLAGSLAASGASAEEFRRTMLEEAHKIREEDERTNRLIGEHALTLLQDNIGILTHCNAGGLATAKYGTATAPMYLAKERGWNLKVYADETRPVLQGARLTAFELMQAGIDVTLITDNMAGTRHEQGPHPSRHRRYRQSCRERRCGQ